MADQAELDGRLRPSPSSECPGFPKAEAIERLVIPNVVQVRLGDVARRTNMFLWEEISSFGSLRERDRFLTWMRDQIADGLAEEIQPPSGALFGTGDRWFRHVPTGTLWRLVPEENPHGPGFWSVQDQAA